MYARRLVTLELTARSPGFLRNTGHAGYNGTIVILTDETDDVYLRQLRAAFGRRLPGVRVVHADASLRAAHPKEDNYFIFAITETLRMRDKAEVLRRHRERTARERQDWAAVWWARLARLLLKVVRHFASRARICI